MKITILTFATTVLLLSFAASISSQGDPAPIEQCRSELASWTHDFSYTDAAREDSLLTYDQLKGRISEVNKCAMIDVDEPYHGSTGILTTRYNSQMRDRLFDFIVRHNMVDQFQKDDANGLR